MKKKKKDEKGYLQESRNLRDEAAFIGVVVRETDLADTRADLMNETGALILGVYACVGV